MLALVARRYTPEYVSLSLFYHSGNPTPFLSLSLPLVFLFHPTAPIIPFF
jgi:hypothetical protein